MADNPGYIESFYTVEASFGVEQYGSGATYLMSGYDLVAAEGVLWLAEGSPDYGGASAPVPASQLRNIYVVRRPASPQV